MPKTNTIEYWPLLHGVEFLLGQSSATPSNAFVGVENGHASVFGEPPSPVDTPPIGRGGWELTCFPTESRPMSQKIDTERLRRAAWGKCLIIVHHRMRTARVLTDKQREKVLSEKNREAAENAAALNRLVDQQVLERQ